MQNYTGAGVVLLFNKTKAMEKLQLNENSNQQLRNAFDPYLLPFEEEPFHINYGSLMEHINYEKDLKRKKFHWPGIKFNSVRDGMLELISSGDHQSYTINIRVEKHRLQITCSCGREVHKLCCHAYQTIYKLALCNGSLYFEQFCSGGLRDLAASYEKYFISEKCNEGIRMKPKPILGKLYLPSQTAVAFLSNLLQLNLPAATVYNLEVPEDIVTGYAIVFSGRKQHLPFLLPYYGKLNKAGTAVKSFIDFIRVEKEIPALNFSNEQRILNSLCIEMWKLVRELPSKMIKEPKYFPGFLSLFHLWEKAIPLLQNQRFLLRYHSGHINSLKRKPRKEYMAPCTSQTKKPEIALRINRNEDFYKITLTAFINNKPVRYKNEDISFLMRVHNSQDHFYLMPSLKDAAFLEWMGDNGNCITVFKPHYKTFRDGLLKQLSEYYPVGYSNEGEKEYAEWENICLLQPVKKLVHFRQQGRWILLTPYVQYDDGSTINALSNGRGWLAEKEDAEIFMQRDKQFETDLKEFVRLLHPEFNNQVNTDCFYFSNSVFNENNQFTKIKSRLEKAGIEIKGLDRLESKEEAEQQQRKKIK